MAPKAVAPAAAPVVDLSAVAEPANLLVVGRIRKPEALVSVAASWTHLPLPNGRELVRSLTEEAVGEVVDLAQPVDAAVAFGKARHDSKPLAALSIPVTSFDAAKTKLGAKYRLTPGANGQFVVEGMARAVAKGEGSPGQRAGEAGDDNDNDVTCVLAPAAPQGGRLVCGESAAITALSPYLTRTVTRQSWPSDVHLELRVAPLREAVGELRAGLPLLAHSLMGASSGAVGELLDAAMGDIFDLAGDTKRVAVDADFENAGARATVRVDYDRAESLFARVVTSSSDRAEPPPAAFWHLPADTDLAAFGTGADVKLLERPRTLLANVLLEAASSASMPETERQSLRELVVDRTLPLFTGPLVYGKGFDAAAVDRAVAARGAVKPDDVLGRDEARRALVEQVVGWHVTQVREPISKVGPVLKDWAQLWQRPAFAKWAKQQASSKMLVQVRVAPAPAGVTLPKDTVHLEVVVPREDLDVPALPAPSRGAKLAPPPNAKTKKLARKPVVLHLYAVPDAGTTWLGFGFDGKLVGQRTAAALSTAQGGETIATRPGLEGLRDAKVNGAVAMSLRSMLVFGALDGRDRPRLPPLASLPSKGDTPILLASTREGPSPAAAAGSSVSTFRLPRAAIEDILKLVMSSLR